jgi:methionine sulfoxide reductase heme-binding subunit
MRSAFYFGFSPAQKKRLKRRLISHHLPLLASSAGVVLLLYFTRPYRDFWMKASFSTAYPALFLLLLTLMIGPFNVLTRKRCPVSNDLRRDIGIWAGILGIAHSAIGQNVHLRGRPWLYYLYEARQKHWLPIRHDLFGFSNYTGLLCVLVVTALLASSNDYSLRKLGTSQWKILQRWNYAAFGLAAGHAVGYLLIEHQHASFVLLIASGTAITLAMQTGGYVLRRRVR